MRFEVRVKGIRDFEKFLESQPATTRKAAQLAINDVVRKTYARSKREIMRQVNLSASYLDGRDGRDPRLKIIQFATEDDLRAVIQARRRATSLNRFDARQMYAPAKGGGRKKAGVSVRVGNSRKNIPKAFFVKLKAGTEDGGNLGIAIRVPSSEGVTGRRFRGVPFGGSDPRNTDVYLLYGPSVQQVFDDVAVEQEGWAQDRLEAEFARQYARLSGG